MIRLFSFVLLFHLSGWSVASACSPPPPEAMTDSSYEDIIVRYSGNKYRSLVSSSENIVIGTFKYSKKHKSHRLYISEVLKGPDRLSRQKKVDITFEGVANNRVDYIKSETRGPASKSPTKLFYPKWRVPGIEGSYGPGDCGISIRLLRSQKYIVFADKDFTVKTTFSLTEDRMILKRAFKHLIEHHSATKGMTFSLAEVLEGGAPVSLLETNDCFPSPEYNVLASTMPRVDFNVFKADPIMVWGKNEGRQLYEIEKEAFESARREGLRQGLYKNAPALKHCMVGQKNLMLGGLLYQNSGVYSGQIIPETNGYFYLNETVFENEFIPDSISVSDVPELLANIPE